MPEEKIKEKRIYRVEGEAIIPIKATYTVWAENEHEALELVKKGKFSTMVIDRPRVHHKQIIQMVVYLGQSMQRLLSTKLR